MFHELRLVALESRKPLLMYNTDKRLRPETDGQRGRMARQLKPRRLFYREARRLLRTSNEDVNLVDEASWQVKKTEFLKPRDKIVAFEQALYFYCMLEQ